MRHARALHLIRSCYPDELGARRQRGLDEHLRGCDLCSAEKGQVEALQRLLSASGLKASSPSESSEELATAARGVRAAVLGKVRLEGAPTPSLHWRPAYGLLAAAAALLLTVVVSGDARERVREAFGERPEPGSAAASQQALTVARQGNQIVIELAHNGREHVVRRADRAELVHEAAPRVFRGGKWVDDQPATPRPGSAVFYLID